MCKYVECWPCSLDPVDPSSLAMPCADGLLLELEINQPAPTTSADRIPTPGANECSDRICPNGDNFCGTWVNVDCYEVDTWGGGCTSLMRRWRSNLEKEWTIEFPRGVDGMPIRWGSPSTSSSPRSSDSDGAVLTRIAATSTLKLPLLQQFLETGCFLENAITALACFGSKMHTLDVNEPP